MRTLGLLHYGGAHCTAKWRVKSRWIRSNIAYFGRPLTKVLDIEIVLEFLGHRQVLAVLPDKHVLELLEINVLN